MASSAAVVIALTWGGITYAWSSPRVLVPLVHDAAAAGPGKSGPGAGEKGAGEKGSLCTMNFTGHKDYVLSVAVSHDGKWVVSGSKDRGVQFWDANTAVAQCMLQGHKNSG